MAMLGATAPRLEELLNGALTHVRSIELVHVLLALDAGDAYVRRLDDAREGRLDPFVLVVEGAPTDQRLAGTGSFNRIGPHAPEEWIELLAPHAAATIAVGTCATDGGVPAAEGSATGAMSLPAMLGDGYRSAGGLPVVSVPGCAPPGDAFIETLSYVLLHLGGLVPLDLDEHRRPRWIFGESQELTVGGGHTVAVDCSVPSGGWMNRLGGCRDVGGRCIACTHPTFPDLPRATGAVRVADPRRA